MQEVSLKSKTFPLYSLDYRRIPDEVWVYKAIGESPDCAYTLLLILFPSDHLSVPNPSNDGHLFKIMKKGDPNPYYVRRPTSEEMRQIARILKNFLDFERSNFEVTFTTTPTLLMQSTILNELRTNFTPAAQAFLDYEEQNRAIRCIQSLLCEPALRPFTPAILEIVRFLETALRELSSPREAPATIFCQIQNQWMHCQQALFAVLFKKLLG